ncbi:S1C family serine protease [Herbiconiux liangxiaofengii]|uniref:S1C family serine protease n=1 Tax=Herbiconiux liangxiaofengii TaxID=3342795 RepID=UPI0035BA5076
MSESTENPEGIPADSNGHEHDGQLQRPVPESAPVDRTDTTAVIPPVVPSQPSYPTNAAGTQPTTPYPAPSAQQQPTQQYPEPQPNQTTAAEQQPAQQYPASQPNQTTAAYPAPQGQPVNTAHYGNGSFGTPPSGPSAYGATPDPSFNSAMYAASGAYTDQNTAAKAPKKRRGGVALIAALAIGALIGGASGAGVTALVVNQSGGGSSNSASSPTSITVNNPDDANLVTAVAAKASPSVVTISASGDNAAGTGSGVVLTADGYIVTNTHVVTLDGATGNAEIKAQTNDGRIYDATVVGTDPVADLAVIKLTDAKGLTPIEFADSSKLNVGDQTVAIGSPLGLNGTVTDGIVSALNRSITVASSAAPKDTETNPSPDEGSQGPYDFWNFDLPGQDGQQQQQQQSTQQSSISLSVIQTDAAINPGNSGGALLNSEGQLIGINVAIASAGSSGDSSTQSGNIGVGFSIPANLVKRVTDEIIKNGSATHGLLGATVADAAAQPNSTQGGAYIDSVTSGGAAEKAGLKAGDIVTALNDQPVTDSIDLTALVRTLPAGGEATLTYVRDGKSQTADVTLGQLAG